MKQLYVTIGHSVVRREDGRWIPSGLVQEIMPKSDPSERSVRTHMYRPDLDPDADTAYLGGGQVVVKALRQVWGNYNTSRGPIDRPSINAPDFAIIGGRPPSMERFGDEVANTSEASVMASYFRFGNVMHYDSVDGGRVHYPHADIIEGTKNTDDDMRAVLELTRERNYELTTVIAMGFRLTRCRLLLEDFIRRNEEFAPFADRVRFQDAEQHVPEDWGDIIKMNQSAAYVRTMADEYFIVAKLGRPAFRYD